MKYRIFLTTLFVLNIISLNAQEAIDFPAPHQPMFKNGKSWHYRQTRGGADPNTGVLHIDTTYVNYTVKGDTIIDGNICCKLYMETEGQQSLHSVWLEEGEHVYQIDMEKGNRQKLFFNFEPVKGNKFPALGSNYQLYDIDAIEVRGRPYNRYYYRNTQTPSLDPQPLLVEAIGTFNGIVNIERAISGWNTLTFLGCYEDGECIFLTSDFWIPAMTDVVNLAEETRQNCDLYDLSGRRVSSTLLHSQTPTLLKKGMYIQNGKKFVIK